MFEDNSVPPLRFFVLRGEDGEPLLGEEEEILHRLPGCELSFRVSEPVGKGELIVTSSRVLWLGSDNERTFDFSVPAISLHAIIRDPESHPTPCLYCQLDTDTDNDNDSAADNVSGDDEEAAWIKKSQTGEVYLVPAEAAAEAALQPLFDAFSKAALLNPDPDQEDEDNGGAGDFIFNPEEVQAGMDKHQKEALQHWDSVFVAPSAVDTATAVTKEE